MLPLEEVGKLFNDKVMVALGTEPNRVVIVPEQPRV